MGYVTASRTLTALAMIIFVLSAFGITFGGVALLPLGLAVWAAAHLIP